LIVRFLDWASVRLGKAIAAKRKVIGLLEEQKQAIIHRAVTRGLDENVPLKPSGLDWLGDVPEHWEVKRAGALFKERKQPGQAGLPMLVVSLNTGVTVAGELDHRGREKRLIADVSRYSLARHGDIAYNMMRLWQGAVGVVPEDGLVSPAYVVAAPRTEDTNTEFYSMLFRTDACKGEVNRQSTGIVSDRNRMYWDSFKDLKLPCPDREEQESIVTQIVEILNPISQAIVSQQKEITLLREYQTRLISDVVTGKLDVREVARSLPADVSEEAAELAATESADEDFATDDDLVEEAV
jgi:type I restriction enzyme S subunit